MADHDSVIIQLEPVQQDCVQTCTDDKVNKGLHVDDISSEIQPLLKTTVVTTEVVEDSDLEDGDTNTVKDKEDDEKNEAVVEKASDGNEVNKDVDDKAESLSMQANKSSQMGREDMTLPWIVYEAIRDGDLVKVQRWLNSLPKSKQEKALLFRLSSKFVGRDTETAFQHAVYKCDNPEIAELFLKAAGEEHLESKVVEAIKQGNMNPVKSWMTLKTGKCDEYKHWDGSTALHLAAEFNQVKIAKELIMDGADPNATRLSDGATVMHVAYSSEEFLELLLFEGKCRINANNNKAFLHAVKIGSLSLTQTMIKRQQLLVNIPGSDSLTPLHLACERGYLAVAELLLDNGAVITTKTSDGLTPLHLACKNGHAEVARLLIKRDADVNVINRQLWTPLHFACKEGHTQIAQILTENKADVNLKQLQHWTPLHFACKEGHLEIANKLINKGAQVNVETLDGIIPLHVACKNGHFDVAKLLLEHKSIVNTRDKDGRTPLHFACIDGHFDVAKLLVHCQADATACDYSNSTPMYIACQNGHDEIVQLLLDNEVEIKPDVLKTALEHHQESIVKTIINKAHNWPTLMRQTWKNEDEVQTTPFREMIRSAPSLLTI